MFPGFPETCELTEGHESSWHHARRNEEGIFEVRWNDEERRELQIVEVFTKHPGYNIKITL